MEKRLKRNFSVGARARIPHFTDSTLLRKCQHSTVHASADNRLLPEPPVLSCARYIYTHGTEIAFFKILREDSVSDATSLRDVMERFLIRRLRSVVAEGAASLTWRDVVGNNFVPSFLKRCFRVRQHQHVFWVLAACAITDCTGARCDERCGCSAHERGPCTSSHIVMLRGTW